MEKQTVVVHPTTATYDEVLEKIKKTGKEVCMLILRILRAVLTIWDWQVRSGKTVDQADKAADKDAPVDVEAPAPAPAAV